MEAHKHLVEVGYCFLDEIEGQVVVAMKMIIVVNWATTRIDSLERPAWDRYFDSEQPQSFCS